MSFLSNYCHTWLKYPGSHISVGGFSVGCHYEYVATTFLNAFINYVEIVEARLLHRYENPKDTQERGETFKTKKHYHTNISKLFQEDVLILARSPVETDKTDGSTWWFFWFDQDCSDSQIACFHTNDTEDEVRSNFQGFVDGLRFTNQELPVDGFTGWITG